MLALFIYSKYLIDYDPKKLVISSNIIWWFANLLLLMVVSGKFSNYPHLNEFFCAVNTGLQSMMSELSLMPMLTIWCYFCPDNMEATAITIFTGLNNLVFMMSNYFGGMI